MDRILIIDDDLELCELVAEYLQPEGFQVDAAHEGGEGLRKALSGEYALIVLDVMLPGLNGFEVLRRVRAQSRTPALMLTARGRDVDRIAGLELGADDYLAKPFNPRELLARIRAILRRVKPGPAPRERLIVGDLELDTGARLVRRAGKPVELTSVEFSLLEVLLRAAGRVVTREELTRITLGRELNPYDRAIDVHVGKLRRKLGRQDGAERIQTIRSAGYIYVHASDAGNTRTPTPPPPSEGG
jgi:two-component system response regulator CpxR